MRLAENFYHFFAASSVNRILFSSYDLNYFEIAFFGMKLLEFLQHCYGHHYIMLQKM